MKPILFNTEMVKAIVEGRKTVTRRIIKNVNDKDFIGFVTCSTSRGDEGKVGFGKGSFEDIANANIDEYVRPPYKAGDILYVRETWWEGDIIGSNDEIDESGVVLYAADGYIKENLDYETIKWKPSIHMPKELSRIFLRVTDVRVERLQDMKVDDYKKEGFSTSYEFMELWDKTIKKEDVETYSYKANPWVWVIEFERIEKGVKSNV